jgi:hypothetical protein
LLVLALLGAFMGGASSLAAQEAEFTYEGARACKRCHSKAEEGDQFGKWEQGPHAKTFATLASDEAKAAAAEAGLGDPQTEAQCLQCHATAFAVLDDIENQKITLEEGVGCESCHGPGSEYKSRSVKQAIAAGEIEAASVGLITPTAETCTGCHKAEGNAFFQGFDFDEYWAKIAHPRPEAEAGEE